jgi:hypothetical protein
MPIQLNGHYAVYVTPTVSRPGGVEFELHMDATSVLPRVVRFHLTRRGKEAGLDLRELCNSGDGVRIDGMAFEVMGRTKGTLRLGVRGKLEETEGPP